MGSKADFWENKVLAAALNAGTYTGATTVYSALYTTAPSDSTAGTEVTNSTSGYTRQATGFCTAGVTTPGQCVNTAAITWATAAAGYTVVGWAVLDSPTVGAGNILYYTTVTTIAYSIGDQPTIAISGITITED